MIVSDLLECGYAEIIASCEQDFDKYFQALSRASNNSRNKEDVQKSNALGFLSAVCSLELRPSDPKTPFAPRAVFSDGTSSFKSSDLSEEENDLLAEFSSQVFCVLHEKVKIFYSSCHSSKGRVSY